MTRSALRVSLVMASAIALVAAQAPQSDVDAIVQTSVAAWPVPGVGVAVVKDGRVVLSKGYGVAALGSAERIDETTPFYLASVTKSFTVVALGLLADAGQLRIDDPVIKYLPSFAVGGDGSRQLTVRDLMSHRTGYPRADLLMFSGLDDAGVVGRLASLQPVAPIRARFTYQNQMYLALGQLVGTLSGQSWQRFVESRLLTPLGMADSNAAGLGNVASPVRPHAVVDGRIAQVALVPRSPYGGGGVNSSARDLARWLQFLQGDGTWQGQRLATPQVLQAPLVPNTIVQPIVWTPDANFVVYGLGWFLSDFHGHRIVQHGGNGEGWTSLIWMLPSQRLGIAVVTNMHNSLLPWAIAHGVADAYLGTATKDWIAHFLTAERSRDAAIDKASPVATRGTLDAAVWAGRWNSPVYGDITITAGSSFEFRYGNALRGSLAGSGAAAVITWQRSDIAAVIGRSLVRIVDRAGRPVLQLNAGGETLEFIRPQ